MSDRTCRRCGERWDAYGIQHGDMTADEAAKFNKGLGCPACEFGTKCTNCYGTGFEPVFTDWANMCKKCLGKHYMIYAWGQRSNRWHHAGRYVAPPEPALKMKRLDRFPNDYEDWIEDWKVRCPDCSGDPCHECNGTGKFVQTADATDPA